MKNPKRPATIAALIIGLTVGFGLLFDRTTQKAMAAPEAPQNAVVILQALTFGTGSIQVYSSDSSAGAPTIAAGSSFAQAIADLLAAGFRIQHVDDHLTYTLVR